MCVASTFFAWRYNDAMSVPGLVAGIPTHQKEASSKVQAPVQPQRRLQRTMPTNGNSIGGCCSAENPASPL